MKDALGHGSNGRGRGPVKPIPGHPFHKKTDEQLRYIIKDASEAARATRGMSSYNPNSGRREDSEGKYLDQVNDAASVLGYRDRGGMRDEPNKVAADALASGPKSDPVPVHDSMTGVGPNDPRVGSRDYDAFGRPREDKSGYDEYSRDLALRSRNGQVGSGMKFRG